MSLGPPQGYIISALAAPTLPATTNATDIGSTTLALRKLYTRNIDTDGLQTLAIQRNAVDQISMDGTTTTFPTKISITQAVDAQINLTSGRGIAWAGTLRMYHDGTNLLITPGGVFGPDTNNNKDLGSATTAFKSLLFGTSVIPQSNKSGSIGVTGTRPLDVFSGNAVTTGTSRTIDLMDKCRDCDIQLRRSTGGLVMNGYNEDYVTAFCPYCRKMYVVIIKGEAITIPPPDKARLKTVKTGNHGGSSIYVYLDFEYEYQGRLYRNGTFLSGEERQIMEGCNEEAKGRLLAKLMDIEWESTYRTEVMTVMVQELEATYITNHLHNFLGND